MSTVTEFDRFRLRQATRTEPISAANTRAGDTP